MAKSASAYCPANGASARAAASAAVDLDALRVEHSSRGHDDEPCDEAGGDGPRYGVDSSARRARLVVMPFSTTLLCVKNIIHGRDGRADHRDDERYRSLRRLYTHVERRSMVRASFPVRAGRARRDDIGHEDERQREKHVLHALVAAADDEQPDASPRRLERRRTSRHRTSPCPMRCRQTRRMWWQHCRRAGRTWPVPRGECRIARG